MNSEAMRLLELDPAHVRNLADLAGRVQVQLPIILDGSGQDESEQEVSIPTSAGKRWIALRSRRVGAATEDAGAQVHQTIVILRDVTAQKDLEQEREAARNTVALAEMSAVLAHEIRNPLASLELFAGLIADSQSTASEYVAHLQAGIRTLSATVNNVLRFNSTGHSYLSSLEVASAIHQSVNFVRPIAEQGAVEIKFSNHAGNLKIAGDENGLRQVMLNLACNAIRHMSGGGTLAVSVRKKIDGGCVRAVVQVADTGSGIQPEHLGSIFDAGFSENGHTPGLGLTVCKRIVEQHHGQIRVTSRVNRGTTFTLEFPTL